MTKPTKSPEKSKSKQSKEPRELIVAHNRSASYNYVILEKLEAGLVLHGTEVKALREGKANIRDAYVDFKPSGAFLVNAHIAQYMPGGPWATNPSANGNCCFTSAKFISFKASPNPKV